MKVITPAAPVVYNPPDSTSGLLLPSGFPRELGIDVSWLPEGRPNTLNGTQGGQSCLSRTYRLFALRTARSIAKIFPPYLLCTTRQSNGRNRAAGGRPLAPSAVPTRSDGRFSHSCGRTLRNFG